MEILEGVVWCDVHGDHHDECIRPYDGSPTEHDADGNPVWLHYVGVDKDGHVTEGG